MEYFKRSNAEMHLAYIIRKGIDFQSAVLLCELDNSGYEGVFFVKGNQNIQGKLALDNGDIYHPDEEL